MVPGCAVPRGGMIAPMSIASDPRRVVRRPTLCRVATVAMASFALGCSTPAPRADFESDDPAERLLALEGSLREPREADIHHLIAMLDSADSAVRMLASRQLERMTGQTLGYHHADPPAERQAATQRWVDWWDNGAEGLHLDPAP